MALGVGSQYSLMQATAPGRHGPTGKLSLQVPPLLAIPISTHVLPHQPAAVHRSRPRTGVAPHAPCHFFLGHELSNVESSWGGRANILPLYLDTPSPHCEEVLGHRQSCAFYPRCQGDDQFIPGHLIFCDALDCQLEPSGGPPSRINGFNRCLLLTNIHLVTRSPARASPGGFHPPSYRFSAAALLPPNYMVDWHVRGLEVILLHVRVFIIEGGLGHSPAGVAGLGMGWNVDSQGQLGHGVGIGG